MEENRKNETAKLVLDAISEAKKNPKYYSEAKRDKTEATELEQQSKDHAKQHSSMVGVGGIPPEFFESIESVGTCPPHQILPNQDDTNNIPSKNEKRYTLCKSCNNRIFHKEGKVHRESCPACGYVFDVPRCKLCGAKVSENSDLCWRCYGKVKAQQEINSHAHGMGKSSLQKVAAAQAPKCVMCKKPIKDLGRDSLCDECREEHFHENHFKCKKCGSDVLYYGVEKNTDLCPDCYIESRPRILAKNSSAITAAISIIGWILALLSWGWLLWAK